MMVMYIKIKWYFTNASRWRRFGEREKKTNMFINKKPHRYLRGQHTLTDFAWIYDQDVEKF